MSQTNNDKKENKSNIGKVVVDRDLCIGAGTCEALAPNTFKLDSEGKAYVVTLGADDDQTILDAAMSCPVLAIKVYDKDGNLLFPK